MTGKWSLQWPWYEVVSTGAVDANWGWSGKFLIIHNSLGYKCTHSQPHPLFAWLTITMEVRVKTLSCRVSCGRCCCSTPLLTREIYEEHTLNKGTLKINVLSDFDCLIHLIVNCEIFHKSQSDESQEEEYTINFITYDHAHFAHTFNTSFH